VKITAITPLPVWIDWYHRLSVAGCARLCRKMLRGTLDFLEEPILDETPDAYEALRKLIDIPFAIGEEFASNWQFPRHIERGRHQFNPPDLCNVGGFTEAKMVAGWSGAHYVDILPNNPLGPVCTAATIHFSAAIANLSWLETRTSPGDLHAGGEGDDIFPVQPRLTGAVYPVPDTPGLGIAVDKKALTRKSFEFWKAPQLERCDGSVTNWQAPT